ncbi:MAG: hypothetical protein O3C44_00730 [Proteobacteria bacterium]|nr:hypothetical protein [Pseudomonadota bacterium]MDA0844439.1 hypothetical protein [Pseudomonadota bacterium]
MKASALPDNLLADFVPLAHGDTYLTMLSDIDRARLYPYSAPSEGYLLANRVLYNLDQNMIDRHQWIFDGRVAVLSVGSNRAPVQLRRKFGDAAIIPVTPARLFDCDIVHAAMLGFYAAVPCTAFPCAGCIVSLNVAWLDAEQLEQMHRTEGIGVAYDYVMMQDVVHDLLVPDQPVYGYSARSGVLDYADGIPAALPAIAAVGRRFPAVSQADAAARVRQLTGCDDSRSHAEFIADIQHDKSARDAVIAGLKKYALFAKTPPWHAVSVSVSGIDAFL